MSSPPIYTGSVDTKIISVYNVEDSEDVFNDSIDVKFSTDVFIYFVDEVIGFGDAFVVDEHVWQQLI